MMKDTAMLDLISLDVASLTRPPPPPEQPATPPAPPPPAPPACVAELLREPEVPALTTLTIEPVPPPLPEPAHDTPPTHEAEVRVMEAVMEVVVEKELAVEEVGVGGESAPAAQGQEGEREREREWAARDAKGYRIARGR